MKLPVLGASSDGTGLIINGGDANADGLVSDDSIPAPRGLQIGLGNGVAIQVDTSDGTLVGVNSTYLALSKHANGDTLYSSDGDQSLIYVDQWVGSAGNVLKAADWVGLTAAAAQTSGTDIAGAGPSGTAWAVK